MLEEKIDACCRQAVLCVRNRLRQRLDAMIRSMTDYVVRASISQAGPNQTSASRLQEFQSFAEAKGISIP